MLSVDELAHPIFGHVARLGNARHLEEGASGEMSGSRPLPEVVTRSTGTGAFGFSAFSASTIGLDAVDQLGVGRAEIRAARGGGVVAVAGGGRPAVEIARRW